MGVNTYLGFPPMSVRGTRAVCALAAAANSTAIPEVHAPSFHFDMTSRLLRVLAHQTATVERLGPADPAEG
jgi:hypothetical protein